MQNEISDLDDVLAYMAGPFGTHHITFDEILSHFQKDARWQNQGYYLTKVMNKLSKDGYIEYSDKEDYDRSKVYAIKTNIRAYSITWDGIYFLKLGGYKKEIESKNKLQTIEGDLKKLQVRTYVLTLIIMAGTSIAAIYYILEILKDFCIRP